MVNDLQTYEMIVKVCKNCGPLTRDKVNINSKNTSHTFRCKKCQSDSHKKHHEKHGDKVRKKHKEYRDENKEKVAITKYLSWQKNKHKHQKKWNEEKRKYYYENWDKVRAHENIRKKQTRDNLSDGYIKRLFSIRSKCTQKEVPSEIIESYRALTLLKRKLGVILNKRIIKLSLASPKPRKPCSYIVKNRIRINRNVSKKYKSPS